MGLLDRFRRRPSGGRLLRAQLRQLTRIADALEQANRLAAALHPAAARLLASQLEEAAEAERLSNVSYVDPLDYLMAEDIRARVQAATGREVGDEELVRMLEIEQQGRGN
jgi:hypothetical protein